MKATRICPSCDIEHSRSTYLCGTCFIVSRNEPKGDRTCEVSGCETVLRPTSTRKVCEKHYNRMRVHGSYDPPTRVYMKDRACEVAGCADKAKQHNPCGMHAERWRKYGDPYATVKPLGDPVARFWLRVDKDSDAPCWTWTAWCNTGGYAQFSEGPQKVAAHRWVYEQYVGPIPDGFEIDHVHARGCRHRNCVNPAHLEAVTPEENQRRMREVHGLQQRKVRA